MTGVRVSPIAANERAAIDGRFIVSGCLRKSLAPNECRTGAGAGVLKNKAGSWKDYFFEEAHGGAGS